MIAMLVGCEGRLSDQEPPPNRDEMSPAEFMNATQDGTSVPHGEFKAGSARDVEDGRIRYDTMDGKTFEVSPRPNDQGGYHYLDASEVEQSG
jgi:hypothetical protein